MTAFKRSQKNTFKRDPPLYDVIDWSILGIFTM